MLCDSAPSALSASAVQALAESLLLEPPHLEILLPAPPNQLVRLQLPEFVELLDQRIVNRSRRRAMIEMGAAEGFRNDLVDDPQIDQLLRRDLEGARRLFAHLRA